MRKTLHITEKPESKGQEPAKIQTSVSASDQPLMNHTDTPFHLEAIISEASWLSCFPVLPAAGTTDWLSLGCITEHAQWKKKGFNAGMYNLNFLPINKDSEKGL